MSVQQLVRQTFRHESGLLAKGVSVDILARGGDVVLQTVVADLLGSVDFYADPGQYDFRFNGYRVPFDVEEDVQQALDRKTDLLHRAAYRSGWYISPAGTTATAIPIEAELKFQPLLIPKAGISLDRILVEISVVGTAGAIIRLGLYEPDADGMPGDLILDAGTVLGTAVGKPFIAINQAVPLGLIYAAAAVQGGAVTRPTVRTLTGINQYVTPVDNAVTLAHGGYIQSGVPGALPAVAAIDGGTAGATRISVRLV